jgi:hypothetical protein
MRLINCETKFFEEFFDQDIPRYAILSHTWNGAEVPYKDYYNPQREHLYTVEANNKITRTCEKAKEDGYSYVWIDSCCIDKSSSSELSEAINSMYKWYEGAERCYVFLSDFKVDRAAIESTTTSSLGCFPPSSRTHNFSEQQTTDFAACNWFTRGWGKCINQIFTEGCLLTHE